MKTGIISVVLGILFSLFIIEFIGAREYYQAPTGLYTKEVMYEVSQEIYAGGTAGYIMETTPDVEYYIEGTSLTSIVGSSIQIELEIYDTVSTINHKNVR